MTSRIRKAMAETQIKRLKKQLEDLDAMEEEAKTRRVDGQDETFLLVNFDDKRKKLQKELEKQQKIVDEGIG